MSQNIWRVYINDSSPNNGETTGSYQLITQELEPTYSIAGSSIDTSQTTLVIQKFAQDTIRVNNILENTSAEGVTVEGVLMKDNDVKSSKGDFAWTDSSFQKLSASDATTNDNFARSVSIASNNDTFYAAVGANGESTNKGAIYIFEYQSSGNWNQVQKLTASDGSSFDEFGYSVSLTYTNAGFLCIGGAYDANSDGQAYVFIRQSSGNWQEEQILTPPTSREKFGWSVHIDGVNAVVAENVQSGIGYAHIYKRQTSGNWNHEQEITAASGENGALFSDSVSISNDYVIVGSPRKHSPTNDEGSVYIFEKSSSGNWPSTETQKIEASDASTGDEFGRSVDIVGSTFVTTARNAGKTYIFKRNSSGIWEEKTILSEKFSTHCSIDDFGTGNLFVALGDTTYDTPLTNNGIGYIYEETAEDIWNLKQTIQPGDLGSNDAFGDSLALHREYCFIGTPFQTTNTGTVYAFTTSTGNQVDGQKMEYLAVNNLFTYKNPEATTIRRTISQPIIKDTDVLVRFVVASGGIVVLETGTSTADLANSRITCKKNGIYLMYGRGYMSNNTNGYRQMFFKRNGSIIQVITQGNSGTDHYMSVSIIRELSINDYIQLYVRHGSTTSSLNFGGAVEHTYLELTLIYLGSV